MHPLKLVPALILALATVACAPNVREMGASYDGNASSTPPPDMTPGRKVNEQDCRAGIDLSAGNLRCK